MADRRRKFGLPERWYRDIWLLLITGLVVIALVSQSNTTRQVRDNQRADTMALCAFRADIQRRYDSGVKFLATHPRGILGISAATIQVSLRNELSTLVALRPLVC